MGRLITCTFIEVKKLLHSKIPLVTLLALAMVPCMGGFFMFVLKDPQLAQNMGLISTKANIFGIADWPSYFNLLAQAISIGGMIVFGFIVAWIFGREYSDRTINDLLALPVPRTRIVQAKFIVSILWSLILSVFVLVFGVLVGWLVNIPFWSVTALLEGSLLFIICALLTILLSTPVAFFASFGRGYLFPLGFVIFVLVLAQIIALTGYGHFFPWSIPPLISGTAGEDLNIISYGSIGAVLLTSIIGVFGTMLWWKYADHY